jgi:hypothetical protein
MALTPTTDWTIAARSGDSTRWAAAGAGVQHAAIAARAKTRRGKTLGAGRQRRFDETPGAGTMSPLHRHAHGIVRGIINDMCGGWPGIKREKEKQVPASGKNRGGPARESPPPDKLRLHKESSKY